MPSPCPKPSAGAMAAALFADPPDDPVRSRLDLDSGGGASGGIPRGGQTMALRSDLGRTPNLGRTPVADVDALHEARLPVARGGSREPTARSLFVGRAAEATREDEATRAANMAAALFDSVAH